MKTLRSFVNCEVSKPRLLASLEAHKLADAIVKGVYWEDGKGCAVGCSLRDFRPGEEGQHVLYEALFALPEWLARLEDRIFEGLPTDEAKGWPTRFTSAIPVGSDLSLVEPKFKRFVLTEIVQFDAGKYPEVKSAVDTVVELLDRRIASKTVTESEWNAAASSAAFSAAESAAGSAAGSADAAAWSAGSAEAAAGSAAGSADAAAWSAGSAAGSAAVSAAWSKIADELIRMLEAAPVDGETK